MAKKEISQKRLPTIRKILRKEASRLVHMPLFWLHSVGLDAGDYVEFSIGPEMELIVRPVKNDGGHANDF
jgi:antitoxin component of MazEF toxin-antitoxin module